MATIDINTVIAKVKDDSGRLTQGDDYQPAVDAALEQYANHRPKELVKDLAGNGTHDLALPAEWVDEFSRVRQVEYPVDEVPKCTCCHPSGRCTGNPPARCCGCFTMNRRQRNPYG